MMTISKIASNPARIFAAPVFSIDEKPVRKNEQELGAIFQDIANGKYSKGPRKEKIDFSDLADWISSLVPNNNGQLDSKNMETLANSGFGRAFGENALTPMSDINDAALNSMWSLKGNLLFGDSISPSAKVYGHVELEKLARLIAQVIDPEGKGIDKDAFVKYFRDNF